MLDFIIPKTKVRAFDISQIPLEELQVIGISQINPYCKEKYENELFITVVSIANDSKEYDEREGLVLTNYFAERKCPKCRKVELLPVNIRINRNSNYIRNEQEAVLGNYHSSRKNFPTTVKAFCNHCSTGFEILIKNEDLWIKQARKLKEKDLITGVWDEYQFDY